MTDPHTTRAETAAYAERIAVEDRLRHVSWGAIFLGLVIAVAIQIVLGLLGLGLGFSIVDPADPMGGIGAWSISTAIYVVIVNIIALFVGAYVAAHLAPGLTDRSAIFHGLSIWALATILMVWIGTTTVGMIVSGIGSAVSGVASATGQAIEVVVPEDISLPDINYQDLPEPLRQTLEENGITPENLTQEVRNAYRDVVSRQQEQRLLQELRQTIGDILRNPTRAPEEIDQAIDEVFGEGGILTQQDLTEMENTLQQRLNLSDQEVQQITSQFQQTIQEAGETMKQAVQTARKEARQTAQAVSDRIGSMALWMFFANILGLIAAVAGGKIGEVRPRF